MATDPSRRMLVATLLIACAIAAPSTAWYFSAARSIEREMSELREAPLAAGRSSARLLAAALSERLEELRAREDQRPFFHYQNLYHDPKGAYSGASVIPSPLAEGPLDPWVAAHLQIDAGGTVTLPTLNDEFPELMATSGRARQERLRALFESEAARLVASLVEAQSVAEVTPEGNDLDADGLSQEFPVAQQRLLQQAPIRPTQQIAVDPSVWDQNINANALYRDLRGGKASMGGAGAVSKGGVPDAGEAPGVERVSGERFQIETGSFLWRTVPFGGEPSLVALRQVATDAGTFTQGFAIDHRVLTAWLEDRKEARFPVRLRPGAGEAPSAAELALDGARWSVEVDVEAARDEAELAAGAIRRGFLWQFAIGVAVAVLAGLLVVGLVGRSERLARQRSQFAAAAAHELRTPLAGLRMYGEMLAEGLGDPGRSRDYARRIADEAERLGRVVSNVLGFSRLERGTLNLDRQLGDLGAALLDAVREQRPALEAAGMELSVDVEEGLPEVFFDRDALFQMVHNLLDNAEKYTRNAADRGVAIRLARHQGDVILEIGDGGPGVPEELRRRLFDPFRRGVDGDAPAGLGLGLALTRALAEAHGGRIDLESSGAGARFRIRFPAA